MTRPNQIIPTAEPFFFPGNNTGILLVHGFTGAPKEMRGLGEYLHSEHHFSTMGVRLGGHATHPEDMIRSSYGDWLASVEDGYSMLAGVAGNIFIMGLSMGGLLALTTAAYLPVKGVVAMSTPYQLPNDPRLRHIDWLSKIVAFMPKSGGAPGESWFDKEAYHRHVSYPENPVHAIGELNHLMQQMHTALKHISVPVLLIHSHNDTYVMKDSMPRIYEELATQDKQMKWIEGSGHVITSDAKRQVVFEAAANFVHRINA